MKSALSLIFLVIYLAANAGMYCHVHMCGGDMKEFSFYTELSKCNGEESPEQPSIDVECCTINSVLVLSEDDQKSSKEIGLNLWKVAIYPGLNARFDFLVRTEPKISVVVDPPPISRPLYLHFCSLRIGGDQPSEV
ncbi:MAG: hypothetical protein HKN32_08770 [Flavobacteriales bacterium]|nr:hypothetical protein [Flavobacteriales bacterium]